MPSGRAKRGKAIKRARVTRTVVPSAERDPVFRAPLFQKYYATNVIGGLTEADFRFEILNEKTLTDEGWSYVSDALVILNPRAMKKLYILLEKAVKFHERTRGAIDVADAPLSKKIVY
jgi:hypothetical protein